MRDPKRGVLTAAVVLTVTALPGCGAVDKLRYPYAKESPNTIWLDAVKTTSGLDSVRISGTLDIRGETPLQFNLLRGEGDRCGGSISFSTADFDVVSLPDTSYFRGSAASWQQFPGFSRQQAITGGPILAERWVEVAAEQGLNPRFLCTLADDLLNAEEQEAVDAGKVPDGIEVSNEGLSDAAGVKAVKIEVVDEKSSTDVWVALDEPHHILQIVSEDKRGSLEVVFSDFDFKGEVRLPEKKEIVELNELSARSG